MPNLVRPHIEEANRKLDQAYTLVGAAEAQVERLLDKLDHLGRKQWIDQGVQFGSTVVGLRNSDRTFVLMEAVGTDFVIGSCVETDEVVTIPWQDVVLRG